MRHPSPGPAGHHALHRLVLVTLFSPIAPPSEKTSITISGILSIEIQGMHIRYKDHIFHRNTQLYSQ